jgi:hypothetical protein
MRMSIQQQIAYREKMYRRGLGMTNPETGELNTPAQARAFSDQKLRKKMEPQLSICDKAPGKEAGYKPRVPSVWDYDNPEEVSNT